MPLLVVVSPSHAILNAQATDGASEPEFATHIQLQAVVYYSDGSTDSAVTWVASDPALGSCFDGLVQSGVDAASGRLVVTARSRRDGATAGRAVISIQTMGQAEVTVE